MDKLTEQTSTADTGMNKQGANQPHSLPTISRPLHIWQGYCLGGVTCSGVSNSQKGEWNTRLLNEIEKSRLLTACQSSSNPDLYLAVLLSLTAALRKAEVLELQWSQVDFKNRVVTLSQPRTNKSRKILLNDEVLALLKKRVKIVRRKDCADWVFPSKNGTHKAHFLSLEMPWKKALEEAEISDFSWNCLRSHTSRNFMRSRVSLAGDYLSVNLSSYNKEI